MHASRQRCWGLLRGSSRVCGVELGLEPAPGLGACRYRGPLRSLLVPSCRLVLAAAAPTGLPLGVPAGYSLLLLPEPLHVPPGGGVELDLWVEVDVAVLDEEGGLVDLVPGGGRGKLALYGPPRGGVLARLLRPLPGPEAAGGCAAGLRLRVRSRAQEPVRVSRVLLPSAAAPVYQEPGGCGASLGEAVVAVEAPRRGVVRLEPPRGARGLERSPASPLEQLLRRQGWQLPLPLPLPLPLDRGAPAAVMPYGF